MADPGARHRAFIHKGQKAIDFRGYVGFRSGNQVSSSYKMNKNHVWLPCCLCSLMSLRHRCVQVEFMLNGVIHFVDV